MVAPKKIVVESEDVEIDDSVAIFKFDKLAPLEKKTKNKELLARLLKIEKEAIRRALLRGIIK